MVQNPLDCAAADNTLVYLELIGQAVEKPRVHKKFDDALQKEVGRATLREFSLRQSRTRIPFRVFSLLMDSKQNLVSSSSGKNQVQVHRCVRRDVAQCRV